MFKKKLTKPDGRSLYLYSHCETTAPKQVPLEVTKDPEFPTEMPVANYEIAVFEGRSGIQIKNDHLRDSTGLGTRPL